MIDPLATMRYKLQSMRFIHSSISAISLSYPSDRRYSFRTDRIVMVSTHSSIHYHYNLRERRIHSLLKKYLELEKTLWTLSTLGGAYSALADYDSVHVSTIAFFLSQLFYSLDRHVQSVRYLYINWQSLVNWEIL